MSNQVATVHDAPRRSLLAEMAGRYGMDPKVFADTLRATVVPKDASNEEFAAFLMVAREYELNPILKEIYAFPKKGGGIQPIVSIDGWTNLINSHPQLDGIEFDDHVENGKVTAITARLWRKDRSKPIVVTEYLAECQRGTDPWKQWPRRMLRHKALIQCARYAFGFAGIVDPDEAERMADVSPIRDVSPPAPPAARIAPKAAEQTEEWVDMPATEENGHAKPPPVPERQPSPQVSQPSVRTEPAADQPAPDASNAPDAGRGAGVADAGDIPAVLDRRKKKDEPQTIEAQAEDVFDGAQWLKDLEGALGGCEDMSSLFEVQQKILMPAKPHAFPPDWDKAEKLLFSHQARVGRTILDGG